jgi:hypothetical protein
MHRREGVLQILSVFSLRFQCSHAFSSLVAIIVFLVDAVPIFGQFFTDRIKLVNFADTSRIINWPLDPAVTCYSWSETFR